MDRQTQIEWEQSVGYMKPHLEAIKDENVTSLLDVGAAHGHFSMMWNNVFDSEDITMVEANPKSIPNLLVLPWNVVNKAVGKPGEATFYTNPTEETGGGSSLFKENTEWFDNANEETIQVYSLDELGFSADMIKIDVQGAEYDVLKYAPATVCRARFLLLELSFVEYNEGAPLIDDVLELTRTYGFKMIDTFGPNKGGHWYKGKKCQVDVLLKRVV